MGIRQISFKASCAVLLLFAAPPSTHAEEPTPLSPMVINARYDLAWGGVTIGRIIIDAGEDDTSYHLSVDTKTKGIASLMSDEKSILSATGSKNAAGEYVPKSYETRPQKKDDDRDSILLTYDDQGNILKRYRKKDDDPTWRPPVPNEQINTARDPLTAVFMLRRMLHEAIAINHHEVSTRTYDGMRLADLKLSRLSNTRIKVMQKPREVVVVSVRRAPINGYTPKELKKLEKKGDPEIRFYFSNDAAFLPIKATADTAFGEISMTLEKYN